MKNLPQLFRRMSRAPGFYTLVVLLLGIGVATNAALFAIVNGVLFRPLPFDKPEQLVQVAMTNQTRESVYRYFTYEEYRHFRDNARSLERIAAIRDGSKENLAYLTGTDEPELLYSAMVSSDFFSCLGVKPLIGRTFQAIGERQEGTHLAILSHHLWKRRFGSRTDLLGGAIVLNGVPHTVVAIMPPHFRPQNPMGPRTDVWVPLSSIQIEPDDPVYRLVGRLKPSLTREEAQHELDTVYTANNPSESFPRSVRLTSLHDEAVRSARNLFPVIHTAGAVLFLITCANVASLLLVRSSYRQGEFALRAALGAKRSQLIRIVFAEGVVIALIAGLVGLFFSRWLLGLFTALLPPDFPRIQEVQIDSAVVLFTLTVSMLCGVLLGILPALRVYREDLAESLKHHGRGSRSGQRFFRLDWVVVGEIALAAALLVSAGLVFKSYSKINGVELGFDPSNVLTMDVHLPWHKNGPQASEFFEALSAQVSSLPGVSGVGLTTSLPIRTRDYRLEGDWRLRKVDARYFDVLEIRLLKGRLFGDGDTLSSPKVAVINRTLARALPPGEDSLGKLLFDRFEIIGVVEDVKHEGLDSAPNPSVYLHHLQSPDGRMSLVVRSKGDPLDLVPSVRAAVWALNQDQPVSHEASMESLITRSDPVGKRRFLLNLLSGLSAAALLLAGFGLYGMIVQHTLRRRQEIGLRMAVGANRLDILWLVVRQGVKLTAAGLAVGLVVAFLSARLLSSFLFQIDPHDPSTIAAVSLFLFAAGLAAVLIPALSAARLDPSVILRSE